MQAEPSVQSRLLQVAELDAHVGRVSHTARTLPQHKQIQEAMKTRQELSDALVEAGTVVSDLEADVTRAEADLVPVRQRLERNQQRIDDGSVSDPKTLRGLIEEVEHLKRRISDLEDIELELMDRQETAQAAQARITGQKRDLEGTLRQLVADRDAEVQRLAAEAKELQLARAAKAEGLPEPLMKLYERLRAATGAGAAELRGGRCTGCQLTIPFSDLDRYRKAPPNEVLRCVECDRILIRTGESGL